MSTPYEPDTFLAMMLKRLSVIAVAGLLSACDSSQPTSGAARDFDLVAPDVVTLMSTILEPAAETYWDAVGAIWDSTGLHEFEPESEEDWERVLHSAYVIAESGNLMKMEGRTLDGDAWMGFAQAMTDVGRVAIEAAETMDAQAVFDAGAEVYFVCTACHARYALETLRPNDERVEAADISTGKESAPSPAGEDDPPGADSRGDGV